MKNLLSLLLISTLCINSSLQAQIIHVSEDFNATTLPTGWTTTAVSGSQTWSFGSIGTATNLNGTSMAFFDDDALGATSLNNTSDLLSPSFDNSTLNKTFLEFDYNFYQFGPVADSFMVDVFDGSNWIRVFSRGTDDCGRWSIASCRNNFPRALIDISAFANANCQVRFRYFDGNDWAFSVGIDNVEIYSSYPYNLLMENIVSPITSCGLGKAENVQILIKNIGTNPISNFRVYTDIDFGSQIITDSLSITIAPDSSYLHSFTSTVDLSSINNTYIVKSYLKSNQDTILSDDTIISSVTNDIIISSNYVENFESPNHGWKINGTNSSWARGLPRGTVINRAFSGSNAFVTNLNGSYNNNELSYLSSPCFDFSSYSSDPILSFALIHRTELDFDQLWLEYSTDKGASWNKVLEDSILSLNWYNNKTDEVWDGINNNWTRVENLLRGFAGLPDVKFRFVFQSDNATALEGFGIDEFSVFELTNNDLALLDILNDNIGPNDCGVFTSPITFTARNRGLTNIDTVYTFFQVNGGNIYSDTIIKTILASKTEQISTKSFFNFSPLVNYNIKLWIKVNNDPININDTLYSSPITGGSSLTFGAPFYEDFETNFIAGSPGSVGNGWSRTSTAPGNNGQGAGFFYSWWVGNRINNIPTNNNFLYVEAAYSPGVATLESPCIWIDSSIQAPHLNYEYLRFGTLANMSPTYVDVLSFGQWINVDRIDSITHSSFNDPFYLRNIDLSAYKNQVIKIRFRAIAKGCCNGDFLIDNVSITDSALNNIQNLKTEILTDNCSPSREYPIKTTFRVNTENYILPNTVSATYSINGVSFLSELISDTLFSETEYEYTFQNLGDFSNGGIQEVRTYLNFQGDTTNSDDTSSTINKTAPSNLPYFEGFENIISRNSNFCNIPIITYFPDSNNNYYAFVGDEYKFEQALMQGQTNWAINEDTLNLCSTPFAYSGKNSLASNYRFLPSKELFFELPCFDLNNYNRVNFSFAYVKNNFIPIVYVEAKTNSNWVKLDSIVNNTIIGTPYRSNYIIDTISLDNYIGDTISLRFSFITAGGLPILRLDDIQIYDPTITSLENEVVQKCQLLLYPNPNNGTFQIKIGEDLIGEEYQVFNLSGQEMRSGKFLERNEALDISNEKAGIYFLQVPNKGINKKVVVY